MSTDIKATVNELERLYRTWRSQDPEKSNSDAFLEYTDALWEHAPSLLAELRRLWVIEEAAVRYREAYEDWDANESMADDCILGADQHEARDVLFSLLDAKPTGGEEGKP